MAIAAPEKVSLIARQSAQKATLPALIVGGFFIGLCTVPFYLAAGRDSRRRFGAAHAQPARSMESASQRMGAAGSRRRRGGDGPVDIGHRLTFGFGSWDLGFGI